MEEINKPWEKSLIYGKPKLIRKQNKIKNNLDKYISARILGRLGNQMFEVATAYSLALDYNTNIQFSLENGIYNSINGESAPPTRYRNNIFRHLKFVDKLENYDTWKEKSYEYEQITYDFSKNLLINGYFQNERYFKHNRDLILDLYKPTEDITNYITEKYGHLLTKSVSVHIRRGDRTKFTNYMPICNVDYYKKSLLQFPDIENIIILTDDKEWTKRVFVDKKFHIIDNEPDYIDLYIMTMCENNIIANSTFSWWGAWLNRNKNKTVIAPKHWYNDDIEYNINELIPKGWLLL
jgi:hypothetical protein